MGQDPQLIRQRNERAREDLANDINTLGDKLNVKKQVGQAKDEMVGKVKDRIGMSHHSSSNGGGGDNAMVGAVKEHPLAALALGFGASRLLGAWKSKHDAQQSTVHGQAYAAPGYVYEEEVYIETQGLAGDGGQGGVKDRVGGRASDAADTVKHKAGTVRHKAEDLKGAAAERASGLRDSAGETADNVQQRASQAVEQMPTGTDEWSRIIRNNLPVFGIGAFALGAIAGLSAPKTRIEQQKLGSVRENLVDTVQEKGSQVRDAVQHSLEEGVETAREQFADDVQGGSGSSGGTANRQKDAELAVTSGASKPRANL